jgi:hypothetical protein
LAFFQIDKLVQYLERRLFAAKTRRYSAFVIKAEKANPNCVNAGLPFAFDPMRRHKLAGKDSNLASANRAPIAHFLI